MKTEKLNRKNHVSFNVRMLPETRLHITLEAIKQKTNKSEIVVKAIEFFLSNKKENE
jgi:hypothetical protein